MLRSSLPALCAMPLLLAQAPLDVEGIRGEIRQAALALKELRKARPELSKDPAAFKAEVARILAPIREKSAASEGAAKELWLVAELAVKAQSRLDTSELRTRIMREVPPESGAWKLELGMAGALPRIFGSTGEAYVKSMREKALPEVRAALWGDQIARLVDAGKLDEANSELAALVAALPEAAPTKEARAYVARVQATGVGATVPAFRVPSLTQPAESFTPKSFQGKYVLLDFWATWCGFCVKELPSVHKAYEAYHAKGLEILSLSVDKKPEEVVAFRTKPGLPMPWNHAFLGAGEPRNPILADLKVTGFPTLYLIGPDGRIVAKGDKLRGEALAKTLEALMGSPAASGK